MIAFECRLRECMHDRVISQSNVDTPAPRNYQANQRKTNRPSVYFYQPIFDSIAHSTTSRADAPRRENKNRARLIGSVVRLFRFHATGPRHKDLPTRSQGSSCSLRTHARSAPRARRARVRPAPPARPAIVAIATATAATDRAAAGLTAARLRALFRLVPELKGAQNLSG